MTFSNRGNIIWSTAWSPDGLCLATQTANGKVEVFDATRGAAVARSASLIPLLNKLLAQNPELSENRRLRAEIYGRAGER